MHAALLLAAQHLAAVVEQARDVLALDAFEIVDHDMLALGREQRHQILLHQRFAVIAEQRFRAAVAGVDVAFGIEHDDALGRGVEDRGEILGVGIAGLGLEFGRVGEGFRDDGFDDDRRQR